SLHATLIGRCRRDRRTLALLDQRSLPGPPHAIARAGRLLQPARQRPCSRLPVVAHLDTSRAEPSRVVAAASSDFAPSIEREQRAARGGRHVVASAPGTADAQSAGRLLLG